MVRYAAHELGGISSALSLNADTHDPVSVQSHRAMRTISHEVRALGKLLHELQPDDSRNARAAGELSLRSWFDELMRVTAALLGTNVALRDEIGAGSIHARDNRSWSVTVLALCLDIRDRRCASPITVTITSAQTKTTTHVRLLVASRSGGRSPLRKQASRWQAIARRAAARGALVVSCETPFTYSVTASHA